MPRSRFPFQLALALFIASACSSGPAPAERTAELDEDARHPDMAGGNSGVEGSWAPCDETLTALDSLDDVGQFVGFSANDLLELAGRSQAVTMRWDPRDSGPILKTGEETLTLIVEAQSDSATEFTCLDPDYPAELRPAPRLELPVELVLRTGDGTLDERIATTLVATEATKATIGTVTLEPEALTGTLGQAVAEFYTAGSRSLMLELTFTPDGVAGWIGGPFSRSATDPCAYAAYATWPAGVECWPEIHAEPIDDQAMQPHLDRVNRTFALTWSDGQHTEATFDVELADGATCQVGTSIQHRVRIRVATSDGRIDLSLPGSLAGGPSTIDPWPAALSGIEPFSLNLDASIALDSDALSRSLGIANPPATPAIVNLYLSSPVAIDSAVLEGAVRAVPIDRTGFATPLPLVELPGGDSERCFDATGTQRTPLRNGRIALE